MREPTRRPPVSGPGWNERAAVALLVLVAGHILAAEAGPLTPDRLAHFVAGHDLPALAAALGGGERSAPATLQLKAAGVFVSVRGRDLCDITTALDALPGQLARLDTRRAERRLVYSEGSWRIDP